MAFITPQATINRMHAQGATQEQIIAELRRQGYQDTPLWKEILKAVAIVGGVAAGGVALAGLGGAGAAGDSVAGTAGADAATGGGAAAGTDAAVTGGEAAAGGETAVEGGGAAAGLEQGARGLDDAGGSFASDGTYTPGSGSDLTDFSGASPTGPAISATDPNSILDQAKNIAGKVAPILGNMAKSGADANLNRDRILPAMENAQLARDKFALDAPGTRLTQSTRASILKSASPSQVSWNGPGSGLKGQIPTFTGGFSGALSNIDPQTKALADSVMHQDLTDQLAGKDDQTKYLDQFGQTSPLDKLVGGASAAASLYGALKR